MKIFRKSCQIFIERFDKKLMKQRWSDLKESLVLLLKKSDILYSDCIL